MSHLIHTFFKNKILLGIFTLLVFSQLTFAQEVTGPSPVAPNSTQTYTFNDGFFHFNVTWQITGGAFVSSSKFGTNYSVVVQWGAAGTGGIDCISNARSIGDGSFVIQSLTPATPSLPTITNNCNSTRLTRGTPPNGEVWYWQSSPSGESTTSSTQYIDLPSGTIYYLKSYKSSTDQWSAALTINYTVTQDACSLSDENYIYTITPRIKTTDASSLFNNQKIESVTYFDGLGRPMQSIGIRAGGNKEDIISHIEYDVIGRQLKDYLPYAELSSSGMYKADALNEVNNFYITKYGNTNPYSEKEFETSPLNRLLKQAAPGEDWKMGNGNEIEFDYLSITSTEVRRYSVSITETNVSNVITFVPTLVLDTSASNNNGYYPIGNLYKTITKDENHDGTSSNAHTTEEFKDKQGRVVLKRTYGTSIVNGISLTNTAHDTYYVYDEYGNLSFVLPPKSEAHTAKPGTTELSELCYQYKYDHRNRLVEKKIPGKGDANTWEEIVYNDLDQPILTRDPNLKGQGKWVFTKYDAFGRVAYSGVINSSSSRITLQNTVDGISSQYVTKSTSSTTIAGTTIYYDNGAYPTTIAEIYTINYYDNYTFDIGSGLSESSGSETPIINAKGLATGSKARVLNSLPVKWITTISYYDDKSRPIYVYNFNDYLGTTDKVKSEFDFVGSVDKVTTTHTKSGNTITTVDTFTYDDVGRLVSQKQKINSLADETIVENTYDDLGQLISKGVGGDATQSRLQTVDYTYNVRGWLNGINNTGGSNSSITLGTGDLFGFQINYNDPTDVNKKLFNGNISETLWKTTSINPSPPDNPVSNKYTYTYDALNRIISGLDNTGKYDVSGITYDKNGNIMSLSRDGKTSETLNTFGQMDNLTYSYAYSGLSNQLLKVEDGSTSIEGFNNGANLTTEYTYDDNGNMLRDYNKGISTDIIYNHLNLPTKVEFGANDKIEYFYDASGVKLKKIVTENSIPTITNYAGNYVYKDTGSGDVLQFFNHSEGYVEPNGSNWDYVYQYTDHLGNIRLSYKDINQNNGSAVSLQIQEENNYYPFGLKHKGYNNVVTSTNPAQNYKYNGKELNEELGLDWYDYGARNYDASLGRWMNIDPLGEQYFSHSPYNYTMNNPVFFVDPDGQEVVIYFDKEKGTLYIYDKDKWDTSLDSKVVTAEEYKFSFEEGEEKYNQILVIRDVFSGGQADSEGNIQYGTNENEKEIPNGEFDLTDNKASSYAPDWYRLDSKDNNRYNDQYDDETETNANGEKRTGFRLHLGNTSHGCVTVCGRAGKLEDREQEWNVMNKIIQTTKTTTVNDRRGNQSLNPFSRLTVYGTITVSGENPKPDKKN